jgi:hypothetical protein
VAGYWRAPRALAALVARRRLSASAYVLVNFVGQSGGDRRDGYTTSISFLARALSLNERTVRRALRSLRDEHGLIAYDDHAGAAIFVVRTTPALQVLATADAEATSDTTSDTGSDTGSDTDRRADLGHPAADGERESASAEGNRRAQPRTLARTRARAETETETETETTTANAVVPHGDEPIDLDDVLLVHVRAQRADAGGVVAAIMDTLTELAGEKLFAPAEFKIVGAHAKQLLADGQPPERVAAAGLVALLRRRPELTQRLCGDLAARGAGAIVAREEWQAYLNGAGEAGPLQAIGERRAVLSRVMQVPPSPTPCPECGTGGGWHAADCSKAKGGAR